MSRMGDLLVRVYGGGEEAVAAAERLSGLSRWVPSSESSPEVGTVVLGWHPEDEVRTWVRVRGHRGVAVWEPTDLESIVAPSEPLAWMPLPEPPDWSPRLGVAEP